MYTAKDILDMLKNYRTASHAIKQLEFELSQASVMITDDDIIYPLALPRNHGEPVSGGCISDLTFDAAIRYKEEAAHCRTSFVVTLQRELTGLRLGVMRLEQYASLLADDQEAVVRLLYFEGCTLEKAAELLNLTTKAVSLRRNKAITALTAMYNRLFLLSAE